MRFRWMVVCVVMSAGFHACIHAGGWSPQTGHFVVTLTDKEARPITNATVYVETLKKLGLGMGTYRSHYTTFSNRTDAAGVADVSFRFVAPDFDWWLETPSHHSRDVGFHTDCFNPTVVQSDYRYLNTNTVEGLARFNELKALDAAGDHEAYVSKFEPKSVTYTSTTIRKAFSFYPKRNPQPMYAYGRDNMMEMEVPTATATNAANGDVEISYPRFEVDLERCALPPPYNHRRYIGKVADFSVERYFVQTNGVDDYRGRLIFTPGCGAYKCVKTGDASFPSTYGADPDADYQREFEFRIVRNISTGEVISNRHLLETNEYMVVRTRMSVAANGVTNGWHYAKILGQVRVNKYFSFEEAVFNPKLNDTNLEFKSGENLAGSRGDGWLP